MIASSGTSTPPPPPYPGRVIRDLFRLLNRDGRGIELHSENSSLRPSGHAWGYMPRTPYRASEGKRSQ